MKKVTTVIMVLSLILGSVALVAATEVPQPSKDLQLSTLQKITDQEAKELRGTGGFQFNNPGNFYNIINCPQSQTRVLNPLQTQIRQQLKDGSCLP